MDDENNLNNEAFLNSLTMQLSLLNDKFQVYDNLDFNDNNCIEKENNLENNLKNEIEMLKQKLHEKDNILNTIKNDFVNSEAYLNQELSKKNLIIDNLKRELDQLKINENSNINSKFNRFHSSSKKGLHSNQNSITSISSLSTIHEENNKIIEKLKYEKEYLEKQLIEYKYKYAENSSKLNELEDEYARLKLKCDEYNFKIKEKDVYIKKLVNERDMYRLNVNPHYSTNSFDNNKIEINPKKDNKKVIDKIIYEDIILKTEDNIISNREPNDACSNSFVKYIKNIFSK